MYTEGILWYNNRGSEGQGYTSINKSHKGGISNTMVLLIKTQAIENKGYLVALFPVQTVQTMVE